LVVLDPSSSAGPVARLPSWGAQDGWLVADDAECEVLACGPPVAIEPDGHVFLLELDSDEAVGCLHPIAAKTRRVAGLSTGPRSGGMMLCSGRGSTRAELARVEGPGQRIMTG